MALTRKMFGCCAAAADGSHSEALWSLHISGKNQLRDTKTLWSEEGKAEYAELAPCFVCTNGNFSDPVAVSSTWKQGQIPIRRKIVYCYTCQGTRNTTRRRKFS